MGKTLTLKQPKTLYISTPNAGNLCQALGACLVFRGIKGYISFLPNSGRYATYRVRYIISHFQERIDIASSSLNKKHPIDSGSKNFKKAILKERGKEETKEIEIADTCLTEMIGDEGVEFLKKFEIEFKVKLVTDFPPEHDNEKNLRQQQQLNIKLVPKLGSTAALSNLKENIQDFGIRGTSLGDISETLDTPGQLEKPITQHSSDRPYLAVTTKTRIFINKPLKQTPQLQIREKTETDFHLVEKPLKLKADTEVKRRQKLAKFLPSYQTILARKQEKTSQKYLAMIWDDYSQNGLLYKSFRGKQRWLRF